VGAHQAPNAAAAATAALAAGLDLGAVARSLSGVTSLSKWRMELHELDSGVILLNDAYNANPESVRAALDALATIGEDAAVRRTVAVLGEMRELGADSETAHRETGAYAAEHADVVVAVGEAARAIGEGAGTSAVQVADNDAAVAWLRAELRAGDAVLVKASNGARLYEVAAALQ
jgi:UDP-N-acetylmuramoyl-tripeptide--D-alanyl-D-alanine ligase